MPLLILHGVIHPDERSASDSATNLQLMRCADSERFFLLPPRLYLFSFFIIIKYIAEVPLKTRQPFLVRKTVIASNIAEAARLMRPRILTLTNSERYIVTSYVQRYIVLVYVFALIVNIFRLAFLTNG